MGCTATAMHPTGPHWLIPAGCAQRIALQIPDEEEEEEFTQEEMEALEEDMQTDFEIAEMIKCGVRCSRTSLHLSRPPLGPFRHDPPAARQTAVSIWSQCGWSCAFGRLLALQSVLAADLCFMAAGRRSSPRPPPGSRARRCKTRRRAKLRRGPAG
jgi:hypothetical protein